jgi:group I intron endonuclease
MDLIFTYNTNLLEILDFSVLLSIVPVIVYSNAETEKSKILKDNKEKAGIYQWKHLESGKIYVGSAFDLSKRLKYYFNKKYLEQNKSMYICNALQMHGYSSFSLEILEYISITNLSKEEARELILLREQFYINSLEPKYNINPTAGSRLGAQHTEATLVKMSEVKIGNNNPMFGKTGELNPMFGKSHSLYTKAKLSQANIGKLISIETKAKMSEALSGEKNPMFGKTHAKKSIDLMSVAMVGEKNSMFGKSHSVGTKAKMSLANGTNIYVYSLDKSTLINTFPSAFKAGKFFNVTHSTIIKYARKGLIFKKQWLLSMFKF